MDLEIYSLVQQLGRRLSAVSASAPFTAIPQGTLPPLPFNKIKILDDDQVSREDIVSAEYTAYLECPLPVTIVAGPNPILLNAAVLHPQPMPPFSDEDADPRDSMGRQFRTRTMIVTVGLRAPGSASVTTRTIRIGVPVCSPTTGLYILEITYKGLDFDPAYPGMRAFSYLVSWSDEDQVNTDGVTHWTYV